MNYTYPEAFLLTVALEMPVHLFIYRDMPARKVAAASLALNVATHPLVWFAFPAAFMPFGYWTYFVAAESFALLAETAILRYLLGKGGWERAFLASLVGNGASAGAGLLIAFFL